MDIVTVHYYDGKGSGQQAPDRPSFVLFDRQLAAHIPSLGLAHVRGSVEGCSQRWGWYPCLAHRPSHINSSRKAVGRGGGGGGGGDSEGSVSGTSRREPVTRASPQQTSGDDDHEFDDRRHAKERIPLLSSCQQGEDDVPNAATLVNIGTYFVISRNCLAVPYVRGCDRS